MSLIHILASCYNYFLLQIKALYPLLLENQLTVTNTYQNMSKFNQNNPKKQCHIFCTFTGIIKIDVELFAIRVLLMLFNVNC